MAELTPEELVEAFAGLSEEYLLPIAEQLAPVAWAVMRAMALPDAKEHVNVRILDDGSEVSTNSGGTTVGLSGGKSQFDILNFQGATLSIDSATNARQVNIRAAGGGADCMFDYLVSSCFSTLAGFTEGMTFTSLSGCTFKGYSTFTLVSADLDSNSTNGGDYTVFLCGLTTESVTLNPGASLKYDGLYIYGSGRQTAGITGTLTLGGTQASSSDLQFYDVTLPTVAGAAGSNTHATFHRCNITTLNSTTTSQWVGLKAYDCEIGTVTASSSSAWENNLWQNCAITNFDLSAGNGLTPHSYQRILGCRLPTAGYIKIKGGNNHQIKGNEWHGSGTATTPILFSVGSFSWGNIIANNTLPEPPASGAAIEWTGTGVFGATINGNTFEYAGTAIANFIRGSATGKGIVTASGNTFEPRATTPTHAEDDGIISISGVFVSSTFGLNTPACFDLELLAGSADVVYVGCGTVSGAGSGSATIIVSDAQYLTLAPHSGLTAERVFIPRNNAFATDNGANSPYLFDSWRKGADIASANPLVLGSDGDYFHVTGTTGIAGIAPSFDAALLALTPGGYWLANEGSGNLADSSGNANTMTAAGAPTYGATGPLPADADTAITLDGANANYFEAATSASLDVADTFSIVAWIKKAVNGQQRVIISRGSTGYELEMTAANTLQLVKSGTANIVASTKTITDTNWHFVAATKSGSTVKLYIDGVDVTGTVTNATIVATGGVTDIGRYVGFAGFNWNGSLAKIGVFSTALTAANVSALYSAGAMTAGTRVLLEFDGACILTHSASLILQGAVNYTTAAGDVLEFVCEGSGIWREINRHTAASASVHAAVTLAADADTVLSLTAQEIGLDTQTANTVLAGPTSGGAADPAFRALVDADIPAAIARDSEVTSAITTHEADTSSAHVHGGISTTGMKQPIILQGWRPTTTAGCAVEATAEIGSTTKHDVASLAFDSATAENAFIHFKMPANWDGSTVTFLVTWFAKTGYVATSSDGVAWTLKGTSYADGDAIDAVFGTGVTVTDTGTANNQIRITAESSALTISGAGAGEWVHFVITRTVSDAADDWAADVELVSVELRYGISALSAA